jgi:SAM-dependent methyltransferase
MSKAFDRAYFDRWYRGRRAVGAADDVLRSARLAVAAAEYLLQRPIRNVLDVGCGEAPWRAALRRVRPRVHYAGIDPSAYVVARFGTRRNIRRGTFADLADVPGRARYDLIVCADVLHYLTAAEVKAGVPGIARLLRGVAYLQLFTRDDDFEGDVHGFRARSAAWYRRSFRAGGLVELGLGCWTTAALAAEAASALERR